MRKRRILTKASNLAQKALERHSAIFMKKKFFILAGILVTCLALSIGRAYAQTGDPLTDTGTAVSIGWTLAMGGLVWFMQLGFAFLGAGYIRQKNQVNYWSKSYIDFSIGVVIFALLGFGLMFGGSHAAFPTGIDSAGAVIYTPIKGIDAGNSFIGWSGFALTGDAYNGLTLVYFFWEAVFAATSVTIVAGMVAERLKFQAYLIYTVLINILIYPVYGHWVWGGGWLATLPLGVGVRDFAGSGVVHAVGGFTGLAACLLVGPRIGKYDKNGKPRSFGYTNVPYIVMGTMILFLGWFGFNPGSTLSPLDFRTPLVAVTTYLAGGMGATMAVAITYLDKKNFKGADIQAICTGALAGLVAVTASTAYIAPWASLIIGLIAAPLAIYGNFFVERKLKIDDPVGAFGIHGLNGIFGLLAVGLFADGTYGGVKGIFMNGAAGLGQLAAQLVDIAVVAGFSFGMGLLIFGIIKYTIGLRAPVKDEVEGLDITEHGFTAYPEVEMKPEAPEWVNAETDIEKKK
ncbi:MAG: ammonium transporter [Candidatus Bathyarchaeota archaeon]|nr:ammonium transporter [Candidatus Bathyarchaeota archaeon]